MGTYSGFLLLEDLFDNLPEESAILYNEAERLFNPTVAIVEPDCLTKLGKRISLDFSTLGMYDLALDRRLTQQDIEFFLGRGEYYRFVRHPAFCVSTGGVCKKCYDSRYEVDSPAEVGNTAKVFSETLFGTLSGIVPAGSTQFTLTASVEDFDNPQVFIDEEITSDYELTADASGTLQISLPEATDEPRKIFLRLYRNTSSPFLSYLAKTYSGDLLGAAPLETGDLPVRAELLKLRSSDTLLASLEDELENFAEFIPDSYLRYISDIRDPLERELYILALYGVFYDVGV